MSRATLEAIFAASAELVSLASRNNLTIGLAESCTGGLIGAAITATPGSSAIFKGGIIAYHNDIKRDVLGVEVEALDAYGAVSQVVAEQMARGCRSALRVDIALSVTGIAGPGGGSAEKPIGTVWIGLSNAGQTAAEHYHFRNKSRNKVRDAACLAALHQLIRAAS